MSVSRRWLIALFTVAFLVARLTGAHLHLCLDGSEPLAQLHVADTAETDHYHLVDHHEAASEAVHSGTHDDVDVDALGSVLAKVFKVDLTMAALVAWCFAFLWIAFVRVPPPAFARQPERPSPRYLRPLLRGPPA
jgi:hypothetical protein